MREDLKEICTTGTWYYLLARVYTEIVTCAACHGGMKKCSEDRSRSKKVNMYWITAMGTFAARREMTALKASSRLES